MTALLWLIGPVVLLIGFALGWLACTLNRVPRRVHHRVHRNPEFPTCRTRRHRAPTEDLTKASGAQDIGPREWPQQSGYDQ
jgi:hypothetical protein